MLGVGRQGGVERHVRGTDAFPPPVRPQPVLGIAVDGGGQPLYVAGRDGVLWHLVGLLAQQGEMHLVVSAAGLLDLVVEHGHIVFAGKILGSVQERGLLVHEGGPVGLVLVAWRLVREHHIGHRHMVFVVVGHLLPHIGLVHNLGAEPAAAAGGVFGHRFVVQRFSHPDAVVHKLEVKRGNHVLPVVVVGRHQHHALPSVIVFVHQLSVGEMVSFHDACGAGVEVVQGLHQQVAQVVVVGAFDMPPLLVAAVGVGAKQILARHLAAVAHQIVDDGV